MINIDYRIVICDFILLSVCIDIEPRRRYHNYAFLKLVACNRGFVYHQVDSSMTLFLTRS